MLFSEHFEVLESLYAKHSQFEPTTPKNKTCCHSRACSASWRIGYRESSVY